MFSEFQNDAPTVFGTPGCGAGARAWCVASQNPYHVLCTKPSESYQGFGTPDMAQGVRSCPAFHHGGAGVASCTARRVLGDNARPESEGQG